MGNFLYEGLWGKFPNALLYFKSMCFLQLKKIRNKNQTTNTLLFSTVWLMFPQFYVKVSFTSL